MTGSAGTVLDVMVECDSSNGRRVWGEGGEILRQVGPAGDAFEGQRIIFCFPLFFYFLILSKCL